MDFDPAAFADVTWSIVEGAKRIGASASVNLYLIPLSYCYRDAR